MLEVFSEIMFWLGLVKLMFKVLVVLFFVFVIIGILFMFYFWVNLGSNVFVMWGFFINFGMCFFDSLYVVKRDLF